jgi:3-isopropylmalate dehydratase small subunit
VGIRVTELIRHPIPGVQAVIARSYAYIFSRNYKNFSLVCIKLADDRFYELAAPGSEITVNMRGRTVEVGHVVVAHKNNMHVGR